MSLLAIGLLLVSALLHTTWNLLLKQADDKFLAVWIASALSGLFIIPALPFVGLPAQSTWGFVAISVLTETVYLFALSQAYHSADFSIVYPTARGTAPLFIAIWSSIFFSEQLTAWGLIGLALIIIGLLTIGITTLIQSNGAYLQVKGIALALLTALCISIYTTVDGHAVKHTAPLAYGLMIFLLMPLAISPYVIKSYRWQKIQQAWSLNQKTLIIIAIIFVVAYSLALFAYSLSPVSYAGAIREVSVVIGALAGWKFLGEKLGLPRVLGALIIFTGILIIAVLG